MSHLTFEERCKICILFQGEHSPAEIAKQLKRHRSVISREINRNRTQDGYDERLAHQAAQNRRFRKPVKMTADIQNLVEEKLNQQWSPEQISGRLKKDHGINISHETIYKHIRKNRKSGGTLYKELRHRGKKYNHRKGAAGRGSIPNRVDINQRPPIVDTKTRVGDWELDTIIGAEHEGAIVSIVDRYSKWTALIKEERRTAIAVRDGIIEKLGSLKQFIHTLTSDNGKEFACHEDIAKALEAEFFFARPYHSWERGLNEHTNGLVRQYLPKGTKFSNCSHEQLDTIALLLNNRPRKVLHFRTPQEILSQWVSKHPHVKQDSA